MSQLNFLSVLGSSRELISILQRKCTGPPFYRWYEWTAMLLRLVGVHFNAEQQLLCQRTSWSELINLIHFVISTCIHSDYIFIYLCLLYSCYGYYSEPLLSTRCPLHSPVHAYMRRCKLFKLSGHFIFAMAAGDQAAAEPIATSAANRLIGKVVQSRRRPLLGPSPGWKRLLALSHLRHY